MRQRAGLGHEGFFGAGQPGEVVEHRHRAAGYLRWREHREAHVAVGGRGAMPEIPDIAAVTEVPRNDLDHVLSVPFALATCVAIASMSTGESASYGGSRSFLRRSRTFFMSFGRTAPASMIEDTKAANSGLFQPLSLDSSTCTKSSPKNGWLVFSMRPYRCTPQPLQA